MRIDRVLALSAVVCLMLVAGFPALLGTFSGPLGSASAGTDVDRTYVVGVVGLTVDSLNPNTYTTMSEAMVILPCYSTLLQYDEDSQVIGDLARSWSSSPDGLTWRFDLVDTAYFCDPDNPTDMSHQVTAEDVIFTYTSVQDNPSSRLYSSLPGVVASMWAEGAFSVWLELARPFPAIGDAFTSIPILPKYVWEGESFTTFSNLPPVGSGPFFYANPGLPDMGLVTLAKNPIWYMTGERGWSPRVDKWVLKEEFASEVAWLDLRAGAIDMMLNVPAPVFVDVIPETPMVEGFHHNTGFIYEFNLNQMSDALRAALGGQFRAGTNNQLLLDPVVKGAMAMGVDKDAFVQIVVEGLGSVADSLVPPSNPWHYAYPDPIPYDPDAARQMLYDAGWQYRLDGSLIDPSDSDYDNDLDDGAPGYYPLCRQMGEDPLSFRFCTLNTAVEWVEGANLIIEGTRLSGISLELEVCSVTEMNSAWYAADYDAWLWDWVMSPLSDPVGILQVLTTEAIGTNSDVFCSIPEYDALYYESLTEMDPVARAAIVDEMQAIAYEDMACQCVAYKDSLYAASTEEWTGLGDLNSKYMLLPDVSNLWISLNMYPYENPAPDLYSYPVDAEAFIDVPTFFVASAMDNDPATVLEYRWFWGDGTASAWSTSNSAYHTYAEDGVCQADVAVREATSSNGYDDFFATSETFTVTVRDLSNGAPTITSMTIEPSSPDTGTLVEFHATATDPEDDPIYFTWTFGDGETAYGQYVRHQYAEAGIYDVVLSVDDMHIGVEGSRPVTCTILLVVTSNSPPSITVADFADVKAKELATFTVTASDPDAGDVLMYTWDWGDGTASVTYEPFAMHAYSTRGTFTLTVTVSDLTGLPGHEVSDSGTVYVYSGEKKQQGVS